MPSTENFVTAWVAENLPPVSGLPMVPSELDRLAAELTGAARAHGISGRDIHRAVGDIDEYLSAQYSRVCAAPVP